MDTHAVALSLGGPPEWSLAEGLYWGSWQLSLVGGGELLREGLLAEKERRAWGFVKLLGGWQDSQGLLRAEPHTSCRKKRDLFICVVKRRRVPRKISWNLGPHALPPPTRGQLQL